MKALSTTLIALSIGLAGCASQVPIPTAYEKSYQPKMWAAHHWNVLAADVAERLASALGAGDGTTQVLYVEKSKSTMFNTGFHDLLVTQLMQNGFGITMSPSLDVMSVRYDVKAGGKADFTVESGYTEVQPPDGDIIVNVSVVNGDRYVTRISEIFYVDETTRGEYFPSAPPPPTRLVEVVGS